MIEPSKFRRDMLMMVMASSLFLAFAMVAFGWLSDLLGGEQNPNLESGAFQGSRSGFIILFIPFAANYGVMPAFYTEVLPAKVRYSGIAIGYTLSTIFGSATAPIVGTYLLGATGNWQAIAAFMGGASLISGIAGLFLHTVKSESFEKIRA